MCVLVCVREGPFLFGFDSPWSLSICQNVTNIGFLSPKKTPIVALLNRFSGVSSFRHRAIVLFKTDWIADYTTSVWLIFESLKFMPFWPRIQPLRLIKVSQKAISNMDSSNDALKVGQIGSYLCFLAKVLCTCQTFDMYSIPMYST